LGRKEVVRLSEIAKIQYVGGDNCYKIFLKTDPYGKGIAITSPIIDKACEKFNTENLPVLEQMIFANRYETQAKAVVNIEDLKYYVRKGNIFKLKKDFNTIWYSLLALVAVGLFVWVGVIGDQSEFRFIPIPIFLAGVYMGSRRSFFDVSNRTFNTSVFFFIGKSYRVEQFVNFRTVRNSVNGMYEHTSVELIFANEKGNQNTAKLIDIRNTKKIENFIAETKTVMGI
jgi:hypothetical protein